MSTRTKKRRPRNPLVQSEDDAQRIVCQWLTLHNILYCHVPNGGKRSKTEAAIFNALGVQSGVPDILIFTPPPKRPWARGVALELKREEGGEVSDNQAQWLADLEKAGWVTAVKHGSNEAIDWLEELGLAGQPIDTPRLCVRVHRTRSGRTAIDLFDITVQRPAFRSYAMSYMSLAEAIVRSQSV